jgi:hypothetical protein
VTQNSLRKKVEQEVRGFVRKFKVEYGLTLDEIDQIYSTLIDRIKSFGV